MAMRLTAGYNDNVRLVENPRRSVRISTLAPALTLERRTETTRASVQAQVAVNRYHSEAALNDTDTLLDAALAQDGQRHQLALNAAYLRDSTLASELDETGTVQANRPRRRVSVNPSWRWQTSERGSYKIGYNFADVHYEDSAGTRLADYRTHNPSLAYAYRMSERSTLTASGGILRLQRDGSNSKARNLYANMLLEYDVTELLRARLGAGANRVRVDNGNGAEHGWLAQAGLEARGEISTASIALAREIFPTGSGGLTRTDRLALAWSEQWTPLFSYGLTASAYRNRALGADGRGAERFYRLSARLSWRISERWSLDTQLAHARQQPAGGGDVRANSVFFNARYDLPLWTHSF